MDARDAWEYALGIRQGPNGETPCHGCSAPMLSGADGVYCVECRSDMAAERAAQMRRVARKRRNEAARRMRARLRVMNGEG